MTSLDHIPELDPIPEPLLQPIAAPKTKQKRSNPTYRQVKRTISTQFLPITVCTTIQGNPHPHKPPPCILTTPCPCSACSAHRRPTEPPKQTFFEIVSQPKYYFTFFCNISVHLFAQTASAVIFVTFWVTTVGFALPPILPFIIPHAFMQAALIGAICCRNYLLEFMESYIAYLLISSRGDFIFSAKAAYEWSFWFHELPSFLWNYFYFWTFYIALLLLTFVPYLGPLLVIFINAQSTGRIYYSRARNEQLTRSQTKGKHIELFMFGWTVAAMEWIPIVGGISYTTSLAAARKMVRHDIAYSEKKAKKNKKINDAAAATPLPLPLPL
ncbi:Lds1p Ecym_2641 [Eremothecium cymbalariae DBVPG|uniref:Uncharacterized protein n=1 Tax=Eremothecium cymbalariae (strain CBS 270.75 / DBVPG 7215 / KCTC 17166 / NRRL Y-17582) TaxID=931890 RepID=G8JNS8_ERECY|nr:Hypothetical protein Ecym_2641 [Eremothecium cymbalariae DBVPG\